MKCLIKLAVSALVAMSPALPAAAQMRELVVDDVDRFMLEHFDRIQPKSISEDIEYCGLVGFGPTGTLAVTEHRGTEDGCEMGEAPKGFSALATWHTHGAFQGEANSEVPSPDDLSGDIALELDGYISTPGGRVWLNLWAEGLTFQLCGRGCVKSDPLARQCPSLVPAVEYTLEGLKALDAKFDKHAC